MHQTTSIVCPHCGGSVAVSLAQPATACPYCHASLRLHDGVRRSAEHIEQAGQVLLGREALARRKAAMHGRAARHNGPIIGLVVLFALLIAWWLLAGVSGLAHMLPLSVSIGLVAVSVIVTVGLGLAWASMLKAPDDEELGAVGLATCGNCGGFIPFQQGHALAACGYCGAQALKPATLANEVLQRGRAALREGEQASASAEAENWRTAREARFGGVRLGVNGWVAIIIVAAFGMTGAVLAGVMSGSKADHPTWWIWLAMLAAMVAMIAIVVRATKRLIADNHAFERRFNVRITAGDDAYRPR